MIGVFTPETWCQDHGYKIEVLHGWTWVYNVTTEDIEAFKKALRVHDFDFREPSYGWPKDKCHPSNWSMRFKKK